MPAARNPLGFFAACSTARLSLVDTKRKGNGAMTMTTERLSDERTTVRKCSRKKVKNSLTATAVQGGCVYCAYEIKNERGPCPVVPRATLLFPTDRGLRALCKAHARAGTWRS